MQVGSVIDILRTQPEVIRSNLSDHRRAQFDPTDLEYRIIVPDLQVYRDDYKAFAYSDLKSIRDDLASDIQNLGSDLERTQNKLLESPEVVGYRQLELFIDRYAEHRERYTAVSALIDDLRRPVAPEEIESPILPELYSIVDGEIRWTSTVKATLGALLHHRKPFFDSLKHLISVYKGYIDFDGWDNMEHTIYKVDSPGRSPRINEDDASKIAEQIRRLTGSDRV